MEKGLLIKVLGKVDAVKLEDQIYNLREVTDNIRSGLMSDMSIFNEDFIEKSIEELTLIHDIIIELKGNIEDPNKTGYTNSREYLKKYMGSICNNIKELKKNLRPFDEKSVVNFNNLLCDEVLKY